MFVFYYTLKVVVVGEVPCFNLVTSIQKEQML